VRLSKDLMSFEQGVEVIKGADMGSVTQVGWYLVK
jgi:hypothetical protein